MVLCIILTPLKGTDRMCLGLRTYKCEKYTVSQLLSNVAITVTDACPSFPFRVEENYDLKNAHYFDSMC